MDTSLSFPDFGMGSCINCGFLAYLRVYANARDYGEATAEMRAGANFPAGWAYCFVNAASLPKEMDGLEKAGVSGDQRLRQVIEGGRNCPQWHPWQEGFDPRWHFERFQMQQLEENRRQFEKEMQKSSRRFELMLFAFVILAAVAEVTAAVAAVIVTVHLAD